MSNLNAMQFTHTEHGSSRFSYRKPKDVRPTEERGLTHQQRGVKGHQWHTKKRTGRK